MKKPVLKFRSIILSDVHLGTRDCKAAEVNDFLKHTSCGKLILNGDIIDGWSLKRRLGWEKGHTRFIRHILKKAEKKDTDVIYLRGNHDDFLAGFLPVVFDNLKIVEEHVHVSATGRKYLCVHGDAFDAVTTNSKFIAIAGDIGYQTLLRMNRLYNRYRILRGKEFYSVSKAIKAKVKSAVSHISKFEEHLQVLARARGCEGVICGHIHTPADTMIDGVHYLNSGDWVESLTAVVEHGDGTFEVIDYAEFRRRIDALVAEQKADKALAKAAKRNEEVATGQRGSGDILWLTDEELSALEA